MQPLDDYFDKQTLARALRVSTRTVDRWHTLRVGPPRIKVGKQVLYRRSTITRWLEAREQGGERA